MDIWSVIMLLSKRHVHWKFFKIKYKKKKLLYCMNFGYGEELKP